MTTYRKSLIALVVILLQFFVFKQFYPFASFFQDSYTYIYAASERLNVSYRPVGYSWFLILVHYISSGDTFLFFIQYCILQLSGLYLYFTVERLLRPRKIVSDFLFYLLLLNPLCLYMANAVSSDALFTSLTLLWLTELLRLMLRPALGPLLRQLVLLVLIFFTRFNALYYPVVAAVACLMTARPWRFRLVSAAATVLVVVIGVKVMERITFAATGTKTFSAFSGWQLASNAMYVYPHVKVDSAHLPSRECGELDRMVRQHFDTDGPPTREDDQFTTWYMWDTRSPLKKYMRARQVREKTDYFTAWNRVAPLYSQYGRYIIFHHPVAYGKAYVWPGAVSFFYPNLEMLGRYNEGEDTVNDIAKTWFHYPHNKVWAADKLIQGKILSPFRVAWPMLNLAGMVAVVFFLTAGRAKWRTLDKDLKKGLQLTLAYCVVNTGFSIIASASAFRYQLAPLIWLFIFTLLTYDHWFGRWDRAR